MSIVDIAWAWEQHGLSPTEKIVLLAICDCRNEHTGQCNPRLAKIEEKAGVSTSTAQRAIKALEKRGLITAERTRQDDGRLGLLSFAIHRSDRPVVAEPLQNTTGQSDHRSPVTGQNQKGVCVPSPTTEEDRMISSVPVVAGASAQAGAGTGGDEPPQLALVTGDEPVPQVVRHPVKVNRRKVTDAEHELCDAILAHFNAVAQTSYSGVEWREKIIRRIREWPGMCAADHIEVIDRVFANPWWDGAPSPAVIYGNGSIFERSTQTSTVAKKTKGAQTWDMLRDMHARAEAGEQW